MCAIDHLIRGLLACLRFRFLPSDLCVFHPPFREESTPQALQCRNKVRKGSCKTRDRRILPLRLRVSFNRAVGGGSINSSVVIGSCANLQFIPGRRPNTRGIPHSCVPDVNCMHICRGDYDTTSYSAWIFTVRKSEAPRVRHRADAS